MKLVKSLRAIGSLYVLAYLLGPGCADPAKDHQIKHYEHPRFGNSSIRYCAFNQYWDDQEGRCVIVPGGGRAMSIDDTKTCYPETLRSHPARRRSYYVCRPTKTIYAECQNDRMYDARLKKCTRDTRESYDMKPDYDYSNGGDESYDHIELPPCKRTGRYPIPSDKCFYYTCKSNGYRLYREIYMCNSKAFDPETGGCTSDDVCNKNEVAKNEETNRTAGGSSKDHQTPMENTTETVKPHDEEERGSTLQYSEAETTTVHPDSSSIANKAIDDSITTAKPQGRTDPSSVSEYSQTERAKVQPATDTDKVIIDKAETRGVDDSTDISVTYRSTPATTTEIYTTKLQPSQDEHQSTTENSIITTKANDRKESSSTLTNSNVEMTTAQPDVANITREDLTTTVADTTGTSISDSTAAITTTELPNMKIQLLQSEVESSTDHSITTVKSQEEKEPKSTSGYSHTETTTVQPVTTTDKDVMSTVADTTDTPGTGTITSPPIFDTKDLNRKERSTTMQDTLTQSTDPGEINAETTRVPNIGTSTVQPFPLKGGETTITTSDNPYAATSTAQPDHSSNTDKPTITTYDSTGSSVTYRSTTATTTEISTTKLQPRQDENESSTEDSIITTKANERKESSSTLKNSNAETTTVQPDVSNITHEGLTTTVGDATDTSISDRTTSATTTELPKMKIQTQQSEVESSTDDSITTVRPQEGKDPRSVSGYSQTEATTVKPVTTTDKDVMSTVANTFETKDLNRKERSTTLQDTLTQSTVPDEINDETTRVSNIGTSTVQALPLKGGETTITTSDNSYPATSTAQPDQSSNTDKPTITVYDSTGSPFTYRSTTATTTEISTTKLQPSLDEHESSTEDSIITTKANDRKESSSTLKTSNAETTTAQPDVSNTTHEGLTITVADATDTSVSDRTTSTTTTELPNMKTQSEQGEVESSTDDSVTTERPQEGKEPKSMSGYSQTEATTVKPVMTTDKDVMSTVADITDTSDIGTSTSIPTFERKDLNRKDRSTTMQDILTQSTVLDEINAETTRVPNVGTSTVQPFPLKGGETTITTSDNPYAATSTAQPDQSSNTDKPTIATYDSTGSSFTYRSTTATTTEISTTKLQPSLDEHESSTEDSIITTKANDRKESSSTLKTSNAETTTAQPDISSITHENVTTTVADTTDTSVSDKTTSGTTTELPNMKTQSEQGEVESSTDDSVTTERPQEGKEPKSMSGYSQTEGTTVKPVTTTDKDVMSTVADTTDTSGIDETNAETTRVLNIGTSTVQPLPLKGGETTITTSDNPYAATSTAQPDQSSNTDKPTIATYDSTGSSFTYRSTTATTTEIFTTKLQPSLDEHVSSTEDSIITTKANDRKESSSTLKTSNAETTTAQPDISSITHENVTTTVDDTTDTSVSDKTTSGTTTELPNMKTQSEQGEVESSTDDSVTPERPQEGKEPKSVSGYSQTEATTVKPVTTTDKDVMSTVADTTDTSDIGTSTSIPTFETKDLNRKDRSTTMQDTLTQSTVPDEINAETTRVPNIGTSTLQPSPLKGDETTIMTSDNPYAATSTAQPDQSSNTDKPTIPTYDSTGSSFTYRSTTATTTEISTTKLQPSLGEHESSTEVSIMTTKTYDKKESSSTFKNSNAETTTAQPDISSITHENVTTTVADTTDTSVSDKTASGTTTEFPKIKTQSQQGEVEFSTDDSITTERPQEGKEPRSMSGYSQTEATTVKPVTTTDKDVMSTVADTTDTSGIGTSTSIPTIETKGLNPKGRSTTIQDTLTQSTVPDEINAETTWVPDIGTSTLQPSPLKGDETTIMTSDNPYAATSTVQPDQSSNTDKPTIPTYDSTASSFTYRNTAVTTTEISTTKLQRSLGEHESSTEDSISTTKANDRKESSSTFENSNAETTTAEPDISSITHKNVTTTVADTTDTSVSDKTASGTTTEFPKMKTQSQQGEVEFSTDDSITTERPQEGKEPKSMSGYSQTEATTIKPVTTTDKDVMSTVADTTDTSGIGTSTSIPTIETKDLNPKGRSTTIQDTLTQSTVPDEINAETTWVPNIGTSTLQPSSLKGDETTIMTSDNPYAATSTAQPDQSSNTDKPTIPTYDSTGSSITYRSTTAPTTEISTTKLQPSLGEHESSTEDSIMTTKTYDKKESSSTFKNSNAEATTAQPDISSITHENVTTTVADTTDTSVSDKTASGTTTELPKMKTQSQQGEVESSTEDSITTERPQEGKEPKSMSGYSQTEATTVNPVTTTDKDVMSTVAGTTDTSGIGTTTSIPTIETKDLKRKERSTTMQDTLTQSYQNAGFTDPSVAYTSGTSVTSSEVKNYNRLEQSTKIDDTSTASAIEKKYDDNTWTPFTTKFRPSTIEWKTTTMNTDLQTATPTSDTSETVEALSSSTFEDRWDKLINPSAGTRLEITE